MSKLMPTSFSLSQQLREQASALLVIDLQRDFTSQDGLLAKRGRDPILPREVIYRVNRLVDVARKAGRLVIWVQTTHSFQEALPNYLAVHLRDLPPSQWTESQLLVSAGRNGAQWHEHVKERLPAEPLITKNMYSAFRGTSLKQVLDAHGVRTLVLAGCNTNVCIHSTASDAFFDGYYVVLCEDACATSSTELHNAFIDTHRTFYGLTATIEEVDVIWNYE